MCDRPDAWIDTEKNKTKQKPCPTFMGNGACKFNRNLPKKSHVFIYFPQFPQYLSRLMLYYVTNKIPPKLC